MLCVALAKCSRLRRFTGHFDHDQTLGSRPYCSCTVLSCSKPA